MISNHYRFSYIFLPLGLLFSLWVNGAIPFLMVPTQLQALWASGFALSYANSDIFTVYAHNFGYPEPAAIAFGLSGSLVSSLYIRMGFSPADSYSLMIASWLTLAYLSSYFTARLFNVSSLLSILSAVVWVTFPIIWVHSSYSMLSTGIALLPFYFLASIYLFFKTPRFFTAKFSHMLLGLCLYCLVAIISIFMDGYSFMMFATGSGLLAIIMLFSSQPKNVLFIKYLVYGVSLIIAYIAYTLFIGRSGFPGASLDFFRGWGVDLSFLMIPTLGIHWLPDILGLSVERSDSKFFGDGSVWITTFSFFLIILSLTAAALLYKKNRLLIFTFVAIGLFGFYMAMGPSFKIYSIKPDEVNSRTMPSEYALAPTGSGIISKHLPGFKNMRASYRWLALWFYCAWVVCILLMSNNNPRQLIYLGAAGLFIILVFNIPHPKKQTSQYMHYRDTFFSIENDFIASLGSYIKKDEVVAFLPWNNDFLINYTASSLDIKTFNIGGDKNLMMARENWPETLRNFPGASVDSEFSSRVLNLLAKNVTDSVVLPYIDLRTSAQRWPSISAWKDELENLLPELSKSGFLDIVETEYFSVVRFKDKFESLSIDQRLALIDEMKWRNFSSFKANYPYDYGAESKPENLQEILYKGWHGIEKSHVWSKKNATLALPVPDVCTGKVCFAELTFFTYGASPARPITVFIRPDGDTTSGSTTVTAERPGVHKVQVALPPGKAAVKVSLNVPDAVSPKDVSQSGDGRVLGVALRSVELISSSE